LIVLEKDILTCPDKDIESVKVMMTVGGGKVVFDPPLESDTASANCFPCDTFPLTGVRVRDTVRPHSGRVQESRPVQRYGAAFLLPAKQR
jgi:hypothetical protein